MDKNKYEGKYDEARYFGYLMGLRNLRKTQWEEGYKRIRSEYHIRGKILDIGCGSGLQLQVYEKEGNNILVGLEKNKKLAKFSKENLKRASLIVADAHYPPLKNSSFDWVILNHVLEHLPYPTNALKEIGRVLNTKGRIYISTPNRLAYLRTRNLKKMILGLTGKSKLDSTHAKEYTVLDMVRLLKKIGFKHLFFKPCNPTCLPNRLAVFTCFIFEVVGSK